MFSHRMYYSKYIIIGHFNQSFFYILTLSCCSNIAKVLNYRVSQKKGGLGLKGLFCLQGVPKKLRLGFFDAISANYALSSSFFS